MALEINASKIVNTVTFKVDNAAMDEAKKSIKGIQDFTKGLQPSLNLSAFRKQIREMERHIARVDKQMKKLGSGGGTPPVPPIPPVPPVPPRGGGGSGGGRPGQSRADIAALRRENFNFRARAFGAAPSSVRDSANTIINDSIKAFEEEKISVARLNQTISHQLDLLRQAHRIKMAAAAEEERTRRREQADLDRIARQEARLARQRAEAAAREARREEEARRRERERRLDRIRESALSLNAGGIFTAILGGAAIEGISRLTELLSKTAERTNLIGMAARNTDMNPNAIQAIANWGVANGVDSANPKKIIDNFKDVRERLGNTELNATYKNGKWTGGDAGVTNIMNTFGWDNKQLARFQSNPLDFISSVVTEGQRRHMPMAQIGRLLENMGDDMMHYLPMWIDGAKEYKESVDNLVDTGQYLTQHQIEAAHKYETMSLTFDHIGEGLSNKLLSGFVDKLDPKAVDNFQKSLISLGGDAIKLGNNLAEIANSLMAAFGWFIKAEATLNDRGRTNTLQGKETGDLQGDTGNLLTILSAMWDKSSSRSNGFIETSEDFYHSLFGDGVNTSNPYSNVFSNPNGLGFTNPQTQAPMVNVQIPSDLINVAVTPDAQGFGDLINTKIDFKLDTFNRGMILNYGSSTSSTGS